MDQVLWNSCLCSGATSKCHREPFLQGSYKVVFKIVPCYPASLAAPTLAQMLKHSKPPPASTPAMTSGGVQWCVAVWMFSGYTLVDATFLMKKRRSGKEMEFGWDSLSFDLSCNILGWVWWWQQMVLLLNTSPLILWNGIFQGAKHHQLWLHLCWQWSQRQCK